MAPTTSSTSRELDRGTDRVRARLLTALHLGKLRPGDRVLSVRRLADITGMNRKTVHRAYQRLADEGWLDMRPGSGTFVAEPRTGAAEFLSDGDLVKAVNHCRAEASTLGLSPELFAGFLQSYVGPGLRDVPLSVVECNREQVSLIAQDLSDALGVIPRPVLIRDLQGNARKVLRDVAAVVTTACHRTEVTQIAGPLGIPTYHVALDSNFPHRLARYARLGPVLMVVRDLGFGPVFRRLLRQLSIPDEIVDRFRFTDLRGAREGLRKIERGGTLWVSPKVEAGILGELPGSVRTATVRWHVEPGGLERLRARLALDLAVKMHRR